MCHSYYYWMKNKSFLLLNSRCPVKKKFNKMAHMKRTYKNMTYNLRWRECSEGGMTLQMNS